MSQASQNDGNSFLSEIEKIDGLECFDKHPSSSDSIPQILLRLAFLLSPHFRPRKLLKNGIFGFL
jgi:hypothetical protein